MSKIHYDFGSGRSDPSTFPVAGLQAAATKVIAEQAQELTEYPGNLGHPGIWAIQFCHPGNFSHPGNPSIRASGH